MMTTQKKSKPILKEVPDIVYDTNTKKSYNKGKFLGKGGFARCYELIENKTNKIFAGKVVSKTLLIKKHQRDKVIIFLYLQFYLLDDSRSSNPKVAFPSEHCENGGLL